MMSFTATEAMKKWSYTDILLPTLYVIIGTALILLYRQLLPIEISKNYLVSNIWMILAFIVCFSLEIVIASLEKISIQSVASFINMLLAFMLLGFQITFSNLILPVFFISNIVIPHLCEKTKNVLDFYTKIKKYNFLLAIMITLLFAYFIKDAYISLALNYVNKFVEENTSTLIASQLAQQEDFIIRIFETGYTLGFLDAVTTYNIVDPDINAKLQTNLANREAYFKDMIKKQTNTTTLLSTVKNNVSIIIRKYSLYIYLLLVFTFYGLIIAILNLLIAPISTLIWKVVNFKKQVTKNLES